MPQIRAEQIRDLTIMDAQINENANIDQDKIQPWEQDQAGWLAKGIVKSAPHEFFTNDGANTFEEFWDGSQAGQLYYNTSLDELYIGTSVSPYYNVVAGYGTQGQPAGWDSQIIIKMGNEAEDYGVPGTNLATRFNIGVDLATDGSNCQTYLNGTLMEEATAGDYQVTAPQEITFNYEVYGEDKITVVVYSDASFTNYATKTYVDNMFYGDSGHTHNGVDSVKLNFNEAMEITSDIDGSGVEGVYITHNLVPSTTNKNLGSATNPWGNIYANEGHFAATSVFIDNAKLQFNTMDGNLELSNDAGSSFYKVATTLVGGPGKLYSVNGENVEINSNTADIMTEGDIIPTTNNTYSLGSDLNRFAHLWADEVHVGANSLYVNGKKVVADVSDTMTFSTDANQAILLKTSDDGGVRDNANISFQSANDYGVSAVGDMTFTVGSTLTDKNIAFVNNSTNGQITFNSEMVAYGNIIPGTTETLNLGSETSSFNDLYVDRVLFRPLAEAGDFAKIDSEVVGANTIVKHQIGASASDMIVFQGNNGTTISDLLTINGVGQVTMEDLTVNNTIIGNAATASKLESSRDIQLTGAVSGSAVFDGTSNISISTTHDYQYVRADNSGVETMQGSLTVQGNLTVNGTTTTVNTETVEVADNIMVLNSNYTGSAPSEDSGIEIERGTQTNYRFMFDEATDTFVIGMSSDEQPVATRETTPSSSAIPFWNATEHRFDTTGTLQNILVSNVPTDTSGGTKTGNELQTDVLHTNGNGAGQIYISGSNIDGNTTITIGKGIAGDQPVQTVDVNSLTENGSSTLSNNISGNAATATTATSSNKVRGVNFHADATAPTGTTRLNMDGYFYATRVYNAVYNDLAEFMDKAEDVEAGEVVVMTEGGLVKSKARGEKAVVGVCSDSYGYALGADDAENKVAVGLSGRVWVKIAEPAEIGDLLISGEDGKAVIKQSSEDGMGKVIGKVLENKTDDKEERIMMLIMNS